MTDGFNVVLWGLWFPLVGLQFGLLAALAYLYITAPSGGTLWLLIWRSPLLALGAWIYRRSRWRWPKSLVIWTPFAALAALAVAAGFVGAPLLQLLVEGMAEGSVDILGLSAGQFTALWSYARRLIAVTPLVIAVYFFVRDARRAIGGSGPVDAQRAGVSP